MFSPKLDLVLLFVESPEKSCEFYKKLFRIDPIEQSPTFALFALSGGMKLGLWSHKTAEPTVTTHGGGSEIALSTEDVDAVYKDWSALGVKMIQPPTDMDFGRTFVATDLDNHRIRIYRLFEGE